MGTGAQTGGKAPCPALPQRGLRLPPGPSSVAVPRTGPARPWAPLALEQEGSRKGQPEGPGASLSLPVWKCTLQVPVPQERPDDVS